MDIKSEPEEHGYENDSNEIYVKAGIKEMQTKSETVKPNVKIESLKVHECNTCFKSFRSRFKLEGHMRTHTGERPFSCQICEKSFSFKRSLKLHIKSQHSKEKEFMCDQCDYTTITNALLQAHKRIHTGDAFQCKTCTKQFTNHANLKQHILSHTDERNFICDDCGLAFRRKSTLKVHKRVHTGDKPLKCDECHETFSSHGTLVQHKGNHRGVADFKCDLCPKTFFNPYSLRNHKDYHKSDPKECPECGTILKNRRFLTEHRRQIHQGAYEKLEKKFACEQCSKTFKQMCALRIHMRIHTDEKPYVCDQCTKAFNKSCNLKVHKLIHSNEKPFKCTECQKGFREFLPLKKHMLKIHGIDYKRPARSPPANRKLPINSSMKSEHLIPDPHLSLSTSSEKHVPKSRSNSPPLSEVKVLLLNTESNEHLAEEELKGLPKLEDMSTIACAKDSIFSKIDGNCVDNIKVEPLEEAEGIDIIKSEMETKEFGKNG